MDDEDVKVEEEVKKVIISITSDGTKTEGISRRNSTGKLNTGASPPAFSSNDKSLPNYLKASTSSCHEFCKYGKVHVFEPKKKQPKTQGVSGSNEIHDEEMKIKIPAPRGRRMKPEQKVNTTSQPEGRLLDEPKRNKHNGVEEIQQPAAHVIVEKKESFEAPESVNLQTPSPSPQGIESLENLFASLELIPLSEGDASYEEPISIDTETPPPAHQIDELPDTSETTKLESSSPTEKRIISQEPITLLTWSETSSDVSESMEHELLSPSNIPEDIASGSSEEHFGVEIVTQSMGTESVMCADESLIPKPAILSMQKSKAKISEPSRRLTATKNRSSTIEEKPSEKAVGMKLKAPTNHKSVVDVKVQSPTKKKKIVEGKKKEETRPKNYLPLETAADRDKANSEKRIEPLGQPTAVRKKSTSVVEKTTAASSEPKVSEQKSTSSVERAVMSLSPKVTKQRTSPTKKRIDTNAQPSVSSRLRTPLLKSTPTLISERRLSTQRGIVSKIISSVELSKLREDAAVKSSRASVSTKPSIGREMTSLNSKKSRNLKTSSAVKIQSKVGKLERVNETVKEKTLYVIEPKIRKTDQRSMKNESKRSSPRTSSSFSSSLSLSSSLSESSEEKEGNEEEESTLREASEVVLGDEKPKRRKPSVSPKPEEKRKPNRTATARPEAKLPSPRKLSFQRGKVVSPKTEITAPRRLKFRQASENQTGKEKRIFRRRRVSCGSASEFISPKTEAAAVVLRHQDVQEKKDTQGLFNLVIEETASKLVQAKKSKVKALVGAFETVISLQETRLPSTIS